VKAEFAVLKVSAHVLTAKDGVSPAEFVTVAAGIYAQTAVIVMTAEQAPAQSAAAHALSAAVRICAAHVTGAWTAVIIGITLAPNAVKNRFQLLTKAANLLLMTRLHLCFLSPGMIFSCLPRWVFRHGLL